MPYAGRDPLAMQQQHPIPGIRRRERPGGSFFRGGPLAAAWVKPFRAQLWDHGTLPKRYGTSDRQVEQGEVTLFGA